MIVLAVGSLAGAIFATGTMLIVSDIRQRREPRRSLADRLLPYRPQVADDIEEWLRHRSP